MPTAENDAPRPGKFCERHWSWLCQAGQGKCVTPFAKSDGEDAS